MQGLRALCGYPHKHVRELRLQAWLVTIVLNLWRNELRRRGRRVRESPLVAAGDPVSDLLDPGDEVAGRSAGGALAGLLLELARHERVPVVLRHVAGLGYEEITQSPCPARSAPPRARVHRGLASLRASLTAGAGATFDPSLQVQEA